MSFLYPGFLFALFTLAIPIIIHLFHFRRFKTIYFPNVRFLKEVKEETAARSKLKHLLILLARMLAITALVLAFAQPVIRKKKDQPMAASRTVSIYVDNSFSMEAVGEQVSLLERARSRALEIADAYGPADRFHLLTNDFEGHHQNLVNKENFLSMLNEVEPSPAVRTLEEVHQRQLQILEGESDPAVFFISDFQKIITNLEPDSLATYFMVPVKAVTQRNLSIDSIWLGSPVQLPGQSNELFVRLHNRGDGDIENAALTLTINGQTKALGDFNLPANSILTDTLVFTVSTPGWHRAEVTVNDYPVNFDDNYFFTFLVPENIDILVINKDRPDPFFGAMAFQDLLRITQQPVTGVSYSGLSSYSLVVLNQVPSLTSGLNDELKNYVAQGGNLLLMPGGESDLNSYNSLLATLGAGQFGALITQEQQVAYLNMEQGLFRDVFEGMPENILLPKVYKYFNISSGLSHPGEPIIRLRNGSPLLVKFHDQGGNVYLFAVPPDTRFSDLPQHTLFVISVVQMAITGQSGQSYYVIGRDNQIELHSDTRASENVFRIKREELEYTVQPIGNIIPLSIGPGGNGVEIKQSGIYELFGPDTGVVSLLAFNYDRRESDLSTYTVKELENLYPESLIRVMDPGDQNLTTSIRVLDRGVHLWKLCIILALLFIAAEVLLLRFFPG